MHVNVSPYLRPLLLSLFVLPAIVLAAPAPTSDKAASLPPPALPATLDIVTFVVHSDGQSHKLLVTAAPTLTRIDKPDEAYSLIFNSPTELYTGLEHSNYTYWQFSWPEIRAAVESSKRYESRLQELNLAGINNDTPPPPSPVTNAPPDPTAAIVPDTSGYTWHQTPQKKTIAGLNCDEWIGETVSGDRVQAWCFNGPLPKVQTAIDRLHTINEPIALVALRTLVPPFVFPVFGALVKGGVTPVMITWGADSEKNTFTFVEARTRPAKADLFTIPKLYMKTTLISMDGLIDEKK
jgi:hypothetical protein